MQHEGQHAIVYGERGVGKTSLAYMAMRVFELQAPEGIFVRLACGAEDDFASVWNKLVARLEQFLDTSDREVREALGHAVNRIEDMFLDPPTPESVGRALHLLCSRTRVFIVIDEFDRINTMAHGASFADLIKQISDDLLDCTICLVGVADDVSDLVAGHASIDRSVRQIAMPRMTRDELTEIVVRGFGAFSERTAYSLDIQDAAADAIANLSQGFPYYAHLLASAVGVHAIYDGRDEIGTDEIFTALVRAKDDAEPSIKDTYYRATVASRSDATFEKTLLACALSKTDHWGYFTASDVRPALEGIMKIPRKNSDFNAHLKRFSGDPTYILETSAVTRRTPRYRFKNPLMRPYVLMQGLASGDLDPRAISTAG